MPRRTALAVVPPAAPALLTPAAADARDAAADQAILALVEDTTPANSRRAYESDVGHYRAWCLQRGLPGLPEDPQVVVRYLTEMGNGTAEPADPKRRPHRKDGVWKVASIERRKASLAKLYTGLGAANPVADVRVATAMKALRRSLGTAQKRRTPLLPADIRAVAQRLQQGGERDRRDLALVLVGFVGALRRGELAKLNVEHVVPRLKGVVLSLPYRKNDQEGKGSFVGIPAGEGPACPVAALRAHLAGRTAGPVFLGTRDGKRIATDEIAKAVKRFAERAGFDPRDFGGHSLRRGFVTAAHRAGRSIEEIMRQTGHESEAIVRGYIEEDDALIGNAAEGLL